MKLGRKYEYMLLGLYDWLSKESIWPYRSLKEGGAGLQTVLQLATGFVRHQCKNMV